MAEAARCIVRAGRGTAGDRDQQDHQCRRGRCGRHAGAHRGARGRDIADRRAARGGRAVGHAGRGDRCVRRAVCRGRASRSGGGCDTGGAARSAGARAHAALSGVGKWRRRPVLLLHGFGGDLNTLDVQSAGTVRQPTDAGAGAAGARLSSKDVGAGDATLFTDADRGRFDSARRGARARRRAFDGRRVGHRIGGAPAGAHRDPDAARAGRPGSGDQRRRSSMASCARRDARRRRRRCNPWCTIRR